MPLPALLSGGFMFSDRPSVRTYQNIVNSICYKPLGNFNKFTVLVHLRQIWTDYICSSKVKGKGREQTKYCPKR